MVRNKFTETRIATDRHEIYCDCCGREKLGEIRDGKLILMDRRHGKKHIAVISISDLSKYIQPSP
jgi:hypothetical protein